MKWILKTNMICFFKMLGILGSLLFNMISCQSIKPYEKELLLDPLMQDQESLELSPQFMNQSLSRFEKLGGGIGGVGAASSCPTCGGS